MMWIVIALVLLLALGVLLWLLWQREARKAGKVMRGAIGIPLIMLVLAAAGYGLVGYNEHTSDWLNDQQEYRSVARAIIAGDSPERAASEVPVGALVRVLQAELVKNPSAMGWYALGSLFDQLGAPEQSEEAARKAVVMSPEEPAMHLLLARALIQKAGGKLTDPALAELRWVLDREPTHDGAWMMLAMSADRAGRYDLAEQGWQALLSRHSNGETGDLLRRGLENAREQKARQEKFAGIEAVVAAEDLPAGGTVFVYLREAGSSGQPLAARRQVVPHFPATVSLSAQDWLQRYPDDGAELVIGARYTPAPGGAVDQAAIMAPVKPLELPQDSPAMLVLERP
ncbi:MULTISPECIES: tetratricopeptide repeat protein [Alcanivorax]|jgi:cytochrome c-type biogenesis protein CcmH|uniref:tetratricopeptide repeat protein n=1 Tax=Alcanivorax TaxID=59753 RepID=UPI002354E6B3|nr:tetratricopeptide repeat protein [Alcanivorax jadensis]MDF1638933.1 tetratricopeptide repeat protein [Alcanivorax jadensis]